MRLSTFRRGGGVCDPSATDIYVLSICAIHGLNGNAFDTWMSTTTMWLRDLLPTSPPFQNSRVMTFGYNADLTDRTVFVGVRQWAIELLNQISLVRSSDKVSNSMQSRSRQLFKFKHKYFQDRCRPLVILCHSLGGLVGREVTT